MAVDEGRFLGQGGRCFLARCGAVVLLQLCLLTVSPSLAQAPPSLDIGAASGEAGGSVSVPLTFNADGVVAVAQFDILFDPSRLSLAGVTTGSAVTGGHSLDTALLAPGRQRVVITTASSALLLSGPLATLSFAIDAAAPPGDIPLSWDAVVLGDIDGLAVAPSSLSPGAVTVTGATPLPDEPAPPTPIPLLPPLATLLLVLLMVGLARRRLPTAGAAVVLAAGLLLYSGPPQAQPLRGDANGDGVVNAADILVIVDQILGRGIAPGNADCNADGVVNVLDTVCSAREIVPGSTPPTLIPPGNRSIPVNTVFQMNLFALDPDPGETLTYALDSGPAGLSVNAQSGVLSWTPGDADLGPNSVTVRVTDSTAQSDATTFNISVTESLPLQVTNAPPQLTVPANQVTRIGTPLALQASASDPDPGDTVTFSLVNAPAGMTIDPQTGSLGWTPGVGQTGLADVVVRATDTRDAAAFGAFTVDAREINRAPVALDDLYTTPRGQTTTVAAPGVLANDSDPDGDALTAQLVTPPERGTLALRTDGAFDYTPAGGFAFEAELVAEYRTLTLDGVDGPFRVNSGTVVAADLTGDGRSELLAIGYQGNTTPELLTAVRFTEERTLETLWVWDGTIGREVERDPARDFAMRRSRDPVVGDLDSDGTPEVIVAGYCHGEILVFSNLGEPLFSTQAGRTPQAGEGDSTPDCPVAGYGRISLADLTGNGFPEIVFNDRFMFRVFETFRDGTGQLNGVALLREVPAPNFAAGDDEFDYAIADVNLDGRPNLWFGGTLFDADGSALWSKATFGGTNHWMGYYAIANLDGDAFPELIYWGVGPDLVALDHEGNCLWQVRRGTATSPSLDCPSATTIPDLQVFSPGFHRSLIVADIAGDGQPRIVIGNRDNSDDPVRNRVLAFNADGTPMWSASARFASGASVRVNQINAFDFTGNGVMELVVTGINGTVVLDGRDGSTLFEIPADDHNPGAGTEWGQDTLFSIIVDVDGDGATELVVSSQNGDGGLFVYQDPLNRWMPTGQIWHQWAYSITNINPDLSVPSPAARNWLTPGLNNYRVNTPPPGAPGTIEQFSYRASDGELLSNEATVTLDIRRPNWPPQILSEPERFVGAGFSFRYPVFTFDPDVGDVVTVALDAGPAGMTLDNGVVVWTPSAADLGPHTVVLSARDSEGALGVQSFTLTVVQAAPVPDVIGQMKADAEATLAAAGFALGRVTQTDHPVVPAGQVALQKPAGGTNAVPGSRVALDLSTGPGPLDTDSDGDGFTPNQGDCDDTNPSVYPGAPEIDGDGIDQNCNGIDGNKTLVAIAISPGSKRVLAGERLPLVATGVFEDGTAQNLTAVAAWTRGPNFVEGDAGAFTAQASFQGITGSASITVVSRVDEDLAPIARIETPANGAELTAPTIITGTVSDDNLLRWDLAWQSAGEDDFVTFAEGTNTLNSQAIGEFDPTTLLNGLYTLRLRSFDRAGNVSEDTTTVLVDSQLKVGNFTLRYVDLELPLNGIPITLVRSYDSRDKRRGDFGVGWRLGVESIELRTNRELGSGWEVFRQGLTFGLVETDLHIAALRLPGGRIEAFKMVVTPNVSPLVPFPPLSQSVRFEPLPGTLGTLQSLEENNVSILDAQPGPVSLRLDSNGDIYNPTLFRYTTSDGMKLDIDTVDGMQRAETPGGQVLTFTPTSISHSNGTVVNIERDGLGRITRITDPAGFSQHYTYDANGDLRSHRDQESFVTRFDYDAAHNIIAITDPLNRNALRNEYDDAGRLISATNANGDTVSYAHDVQGRRELLTDPEGNVTVFNYDDDGNVVRVTDPLGGITTNTYDARGNRLSTTNAEGETTTYGYDSRNNLVSVTDPIGATSTYTFDGLDQLTAQTDALGRITRYAYDASRRIASLIDAAGNTQQTLRDEAGNLIARIDARGSQQRYEHDHRGYVTSILDPRGNRVSRVLDPNGNVLTSTDARGGTDTHSVDKRGWTEQVIAPEGNGMLFEFNAVGELASVTDNAGQTSAVLTDASNRVTRVENADGSANLMFYDGRGYRTAVVDSSGRETRYEYDALGRQIRTILPGGGVAEATYDAVGRTLTETDPGGNVTSYVYDAAGRNTALVDALGNRTEFTYDLVGNLTSRLDARGNLTEYHYDVLDRLIETRYPDGSVETTDYDEVGNIVAASDRLGRITSYTYDPSDNLISVTDIAGAVTTYAYDENNNRISQTDANGHTTRMVYDANDRLVEKQYPDGSTESYSYDAGGRLARTVLPDGKYMDATFDGFGRPTGHDLNGEGAESFAYDGAGRLTQAVNLWGTVDYSYDADGRVSEIVSGGGHAVRYTHDDSGNRTSIATQLAGQSERVTRYTYDALNRLATVVEPDGGTTTYSYDPVGNVASIAYPNGVVSSFTYDDVNQLTRIEHRQGATILAAYAYTLDGGGRRLRVDHANGDSVSYGYDSADRLLQETHRNDSGVVIFEQVFSYDAVGNRVTQQISGQAQTLFFYDSADKLLSAGAASFHYDPNGRLVSQTAPQGTIAYTYDVEGQLLRVTTSTGTVSYAYDANGKRRQRIANGNQQNYLLDEASLTGYDQTLVAYDGSGSQMVEYHWGDRLLSADDGGSERFYHFDGGRNTRLLTDETGTVSDTYDYTAFGKVRARTGLADNPYGFAGEWQASQEGLVYLRARYYDPSTGRFISRDPFAGNASDPVSLHRYLYANANPIMNIDPSGMVALTVGEVIFVNAAISAGISLIFDGLAGRSAGEAIANAIIAAGFGAIGGAVGGRLAATAQKSMAAAAGASLTRKGTIAMSIVFTKAAVNTLLGVAQLGSNELSAGTRGRYLTAQAVGQMFVVNFLVEAITLGYYRFPMVKQDGPRVTLITPSSSTAAKSALQSASGARSQNLFRRWQASGEEIIPFLEKWGRGKSASNPANRVLANLAEMASEAEVVILTVFVEELKVIETSAKAAVFLETGKQTVQGLWSASSN